MAYTKDELRRLCREWQDRLGLAHWHIDAEIVRGAEIDDNLGQVDVAIERECALVRLKTHEDYHSAFPYDIEQTLVHELLHIVFDMAGVEGNEMFEQAVDRIARVLVRMKREKAETTAPVA